MGSAGSVTIREVLAPVLGKALSTQTVSRIARSLDTEVRRYHTCLLEDRYAHLFPYGVTLKASPLRAPARRVRTTNTIERAFREIRRLLDAADGLKGVNVYAIMFMRRVASRLSLHPAEVAE